MIKGSHDNHKNIKTDFYIFIFYHSALVWQRLVQVRDDGGGGDDGYEDGV